MSSDTVLIPKYKSPISMMIVNDYSLVVTKNNGHESKVLYLDVVINYSNETFNKCIYKIEEEDLDKKFTCFQI